MVSSLLYLLLEISIMNYMREQALAFGVPRGSSENRPFGVALFHLILKSQCPLIISVTAEKACKIKCCILYLAATFVRGSYSPRNLITFNGSTREM